MRKRWTPSPRDVAAAGCSTEPRDISTQTQIKGKVS